MAETETLTRDEVLEALKDVYDPEIPVNVVDLGLVYDLKVDEGDVDITMTLTFAGAAWGRTSPSRPSGGSQSSTASRT